MSYPDYPYKTSINRSFISSDEVLEYFHQYAESFDLYKHIKFEHHVLRVRPLMDDKWEFIVKNLQAGECKTHIFDAVLICNGISVPFIRKIDGHDIFEGRQLHSHSYRKAEDYENENVCVIGGGPSGIDLAMEIGKTAKRLFWSHHMKESFGKEVKVQLPNDVVQKVDALKFTKTGAEFKDGSCESFSTVIYATGYNYSFPFLSIDCGLSCHEKYIQPVYKHCLNINRPSMAIIGSIPYFLVAMPMFDLQVRFCLTFMTGRKQLPSKEEMLNDTEREMSDQWARGLKRHKAHFIGMEKHEAYYKELATAADIEGLKPVIGKMFNKSFGNYFENFNTFRNYCFKVIDDENFITSEIDSEN